MVSKIRKWGNSLGLRIPKSFAEEAQVREGSDVDLRVEGGRLIVQAVTPTTYRLDELLARITRRNIHREIDTGGAIGREVW